MEREQGDRSRWVWIPKWEDNSQGGKGMVAQAGEKASEVTEELPRLMQRVCCRTAANVHGPFAFYDLM